MLPTFILSILSLSKIMKIMKKPILWLLLYSFQMSFAQQKLPIIHATSKSVDVREGPIFRKDDWTISPEKKIDIFYKRRCKTPEKVTFYTDIDSLSMMVEPDKVYDFIIVLNHKDSCLTRISPLKTYRKEGKKLPVSNDTIPFELGRDNRIYLKGRINDSSPIKILYDTGAEGSGIFKGVVGNKVKMNFDGTGVTIGTGGSITTLISGKNKIQIADLIWDDEPISTANKEFGQGSDAIVGYSIFSDKIVEINFDKNIMIIHDQPINTNDYLKFKMKKGGVIPVVKVTLELDNRKITDWLHVDMGGTSTLTLNKDFATKHNLYGKMQKLNESIISGVGPATIKAEGQLLSQLYMGKTAFKNVPIVVENSENNNTGLGSFMGMDLHKRFNTVIDYQNEYIYLKPNGLINESFQIIRKTNNRNVTFIALGVLAVIVGAYLYFKNRFKQSKS
jgi:hypothetical protein